MIDGNKAGLYDKKGNALTLKETNDADWRIRRIRFYLRRFAGLAALVSCVLVAVSTPQCYSGGVHMKEGMT